MIFDKKELKYVWCKNGWFHLNELFQNSVNFLIFRTTTTKMSLKTQLSFPLITNLQIEDKEFSFDKKWIEQFEASQMNAIELQVDDQKMDLDEPELEHPHEGNKKLELSEEVEKSEQQCDANVQVISDKEKELLYKNVKEEVPTCHCLELENGNCLNGKRSKGKGSFKKCVTLYVSLL